MASRDFGSVALVFWKNTMKKRIIRLLLLSAVVGIIVWAVFRRSDSNSAQVTEVIDQMNAIVQ